LFLADGFMGLPDYSHGLGGVFVLATKVHIDPLTRIEGHLAIDLDIDGGRVGEARCKGEMFRGLEVLLRGRHPMDAQQITQRICGVCPISHGTASILAQDMAYGIELNDNGRVVRNLILGANYIASHIVHFYQLSALDYVDIAAITAYTGKEPALVGLRDWVTSQLGSGVLYPAAPFLPRYEGDYITDHDLNIGGIKHYLQALDMRAMAHKCAAIWCGKIPHATALIPGGVTEKVSSDKIAAYAGYLATLRTFINECYIPDVLAVASAYPAYWNLGVGPTNFLSYGVFPENSSGSKTLFPSGVVINGKLEAFSEKRIREEVKNSFFSSGTGLHPSEGETNPDPKKAEAYTWLKAPRYNGHPMEVGPLARMVVAYMQGQEPVNGIIDSVLAQVGGTPNHLFSALGRHAARAIECKIVADRCAEWIEMLVPGQSAFEDFKVPDACSGYGLTEAPRGALGHWLSVKDGVIDNYQCIVPTTWNCSPRDDKGVPGPMEQALIGTPIANEEHPIEAARVVRSYDPCLACAVH
jgi:Ni,Fe-hydrogenase I large subunit